MNIDIGITAVFVFGLIGISVAIFASNFFDGYEKKMAKINTAILGLLENAKDDLVRMESEKGQTLIVKKEQGKKRHNKGQEKNYEDLITFMRKSKFLKYANEHEELLDFDLRGRKEIHKLALTVLGFIGPTILLQQVGDLYVLGILWLSLDFGFLMMFINNIKEFIIRIDNLYKEHIIGQESFGGYD